MTPLFKKLNLKNQAPVYILNPPESFAPELTLLEAAGVQVRELKGDAPAEFILIFALRKEQIDQAASLVAKHLTADGILWFAYPKQSSKRFQCDFSRDTGWDSLGQQGFEPVRQVAIDEDWSAIRFRRVDYIKAMVRKEALSQEGRKKANLD